MKRLNVLKQLAALLLCGAGLAHAALPIEQWTQASGARVRATPPSAPDTVTTAPAASRNKVVS